MTLWIHLSQNFERQWWFPQHFHGSEPSHGKGACITQLNYKPCHEGGVTQEEQGDVKCSEKMWYTGGGNGTHSQYS